MRLSILAAALLTLPLAAQEPAVFSRDGISFSHPADLTRRDGAPEENGWATVLVRSEAAAITVMRIRWMEPWRSATEADRWALLREAARVGTSGTARADSIIPIRMPGYVAGRRGTGVGTDFLYIPRTGVPFLLHLQVKGMSYRELTQVISSLRLPTVSGEPPVGRPDPVVIQGASLRPPAGFTLFHRDTTAGAGSMVSQRLRKEPPALILFRRTPAPAGVVADAGADRARIMEARLRGVRGTVRSADAPVRLTRPGHLAVAMRFVQQGGDRGILWTFLPQAGAIEFTEVVAVGLSREEEDSLIASLRLPAAAAPVSARREIFRRDGVELELPAGLPAFRPYPGSEQIPDGWAMVTDLADSAVIGLSFSRWADLSTAEDRRRLMDHLATKPEDEVRALDVPRPYVRPGFLAQRESLRLPNGRPGTMWTFIPREGPVYHVVLMTSGLMTAETERMLSSLRLP